MVLTWRKPARHTQRSDGGAPQMCQLALPIGNFPRLQNPDPILKTPLFLPLAILICEQVALFHPSFPPHLGTQQALPPMQKMSECQEA